MASINEIHYLDDHRPLNISVASSAIAEFIPRISRQEKTATTVYASPLRLSPALVNMPRGWLDDDDKIILLKDSGTFAKATRQ